MNNDEMLRRCWAEKIYFRGRLDEAVSNLGVEHKTHTRVTMYIARHQKIDLDFDNGNHPMINCIMNFDLDAAVRRPNNGFGKQCRMVTEEVRRLIQLDIDSGEIEKKLSKILKSMPRRRNTL